MFEEKRSRRKPDSSASVLSVDLSLAGAECELVVRSSSLSFLLSLSSSLLAKIG